MLSGAGPLKALLQTCPDQGAWPLETVLSQENKKSEGFSLKTLNYASVNSQVVYFWPS